MKVVLQRVSRAAVRVDGETVGEIGPGLLLLAAFRSTDSASELDWMARKCVELRIFRDDEDKMNLSLSEVGGEILLGSGEPFDRDAERARIEDVVRKLREAGFVPGESETLRAF